MGVGTGPMCSTRGPKAAPAPAQPVATERGGWIEVVTWQGIGGPPRALRPRRVVYRGQEGSGGVWGDRGSWVSHTLF